MLIKYLKGLRRAIRNRRRFFWGRNWRLRSKLTPRSLKDQALSYLQANQEQMLFVLGSGRSGTQLVTDLLSKSCKTVAFHEPNFRENAR